MGTVKQVVCLANSRKMLGRCVAGRIVDKDGLHGWIRPVGSGTHEELSEIERMCTDGKEPGLMDILEIPLLEPAPHTYQTENWRVDPSKRWKRIGPCSPMVRERCIEYPEILWKNGYSSGSAINDRIPLEVASELNRSLYMIYLEELVIRIFRAFGNRKLQARFRYIEHDYALRITDPRIEASYHNSALGTYRLNDVFLAVSLGEPFDGYVYKLAAAIIQPD